MKKIGRWYLFNEVTMEEEIDKLANEIEEYIKENYNKDFDIEVLCDSEFNDNNVTDDVIVFEGVTNDFEIVLRAKYNDPHLVCEDGELKIYYLYDLCSSGCTDPKTLINTGHLDYYVEEVLESIVIDRFFQEVRVMTRTEMIINRIPINIKQKLDNMKWCKHEFNRMGNHGAEKEYKDIMRGIILCLMDMGIIDSDSEFRCLYVYYCTMQFIFIE